MKRILDRIKLGNILRDFIRKQNYGFFDKVRHIPGIDSCEKRIEGFGEVYTINYDVYVYRDKFNGKLWKFMLFYATQDDIIKLQRFIIEHL